ncbi:MAG: cation diffusion facilitator family transporter [Bacteroidales bacterium]|jgi:cation diffusion facilitator family transporter|nr:cation diffusion facilitator family transporter [Bacteroidales bacterium]
MNVKVKTASLSIISNTLLIIMKVVVGILSGSVSIISEAIHSSMDLVAAIIAFFSVKVSDNPPDSKHPYGHGKVENISGVVEAILIFAAAAMIIVEAIKKLLGEEIVLEKLWIGSVVMAISAIVNIFVSRRLYQVARETKSVALEADALHLKTDVYTSAGVAVGLVLILLTDIKWLDPVVAILVALFIIKESYELLRRAFWPLLDSSWAIDEVNELEKKLNEMGVNYHSLRTRKAGNYRFIDIHVEISEDESVGNAHRYCDQIEDQLMTSFENLNVTIHVEPVERK